MNSSTYPRPKLKTKPLMTEGRRFFWSFFIPAFAGWFTTIYLFQLSTSGQGDLRPDTAIVGLLVTPIFMAVSLITGIPILCLAACLAFAGSMQFPILRFIKPLLAVALGLAVYWVLGRSFLPGYMQGMEAEGITPWPFWMVQYPAAGITAASAWISSALLYRKAQRLTTLPLSEQIQPQVDSPLQVEEESQDVTL